MKTVLAMLFSVFVFVAIVAFEKWYKYTQEQKLRGLVSWSAIGDYSPAFGRYSYVRELLIAVLNAQYNDAIDKKYRIAEEIEKQYVNEILKEYQKDIMRSYFKGHLALIKSKYAIRGEDYFMFSLHDFLSEHQCDYKFLGYDMHKERLEYTRYGETISAGFDATYALTDFAIVYHKLYFIAYMYCKNSKITNPNGNCFCNEKFIKDILDTNQIQISRY